MMQLNKIFLTSLLIVVFILYSIYYRSSVISDLPSSKNASLLATPIASLKPSVIPSILPTPIRRGGEDGYDEEGNPIIVPTSKVQPTVGPIKVPTAIPSPTTGGQYKDGSYTGSVADAYYGLIQVQAIIQGGQINDVQFLSYPNDRQNSIRINTYAMPILKSEAIQAQNANVDIVSGATLSSQAFQQSLASALVKAKN